MWSEIECAVVCVLLSSLPAQSPQSRPTEPPSREQLARILAKGHHLDHRLSRMASFDAQLSITPLGRNVDTVTVSIKTLFCLDVPRGGSRKPFDMIRYSLDEGGKRVERGRDAYGYWFRSDSKVTPLDDANGATDRELVQREISLAKQLLRVVDPGAILEGLQGKVRVTAGKLPLGKAQEARYWVAEGTLEDYPFYTLPQEKGQRRARVRVYVDKSTGMLSAVEARHPPTGRRELVLFRDYARQDVAGTDTGKTGVTLPTRLKIYQAGGGEYEQVVQVVIPSVLLNKPLTAADFQRSR